MLQFLPQQMAISIFLSDAFWENLRSVCGGGGRGLSILPSFWISERAQKLLISNPISPLRCLYDHPFYINLILPQDIPYNLCSEGCKRNVILKYKVSGPFYYVEQNYYLKIWIGCVWGNSGHGRGVSYPPITFEH